MIGQHSLAPKQCIHCKRNGLLPVTIPDWERNGCENQQGEENGSGRDQHLPTLRDADEEHDEEIDLLLPARM